MNNVLTRETKHRTSVYENGRTITFVIHALNGNREIRFFGRATCSNYDVFDYDFGLKLARAKAYRKFTKFLIAQFKEMEIKHSREVQALYDDLRREEVRLSAALAYRDTLSAHLKTIENSIKEMQESCVAVGIPLKLNIEKVGDSKYDYTIESTWTPRKLRGRKNNVDINH